MITLGKALDALLRANGVPGPVIAVQGGPETLTVHYRRPDHGEASVVLDLHADAHPAGPIQHGTVEQLMRDMGDYDGTPGWTPPSGC